MNVTKGNKIYIGETDRQRIQRINEHKTNCLLFVRNTKIILTRGYKLGDSHVTLPYADDFCLISTHKTAHRNIINKINPYVEFMGMKLKPTKCR